MAAIVEGYVHEGNDSNISVLSYNVLLPNSMDGWWVHKMYSPRHQVPIEHTTWPYRQNQLRRDIAMANCDIVCLQEVCCDSFESDFAFMKEIGYDKCEIYRRGRFRPATFWKSSRVVPTQAPIHRDRVLIIPFENASNDTVSASIALGSVQEVVVKFPLYVVNCHLQAGPHTADRRLRQVHDGLETIRKDASKIASAHIAAFRKAHKRKGKGKKGSEDSVDAPPPPPPPAALSLTDAELLKQALLQVPIVILGDTNCDPDDACGVHALLVHGEADVSGKVDRFTSGGNIEEGKKSSKPKSHVFGGFVDAYENAYTSAGREVPPTMICEELFGVLTLSDVEDGTGDIYKLAPIAVTTLRNIFLKFAKTQSESAMSEHRVFVGNLIRESEETFVMSVEDVRAWLTTINGRPDRGSELRASVKYMKVASKAEGDNCDNNQSASVIGGDEEEAEVPAAALPEDGFLTFEGFLAIYADMVYEGKVWAVSYDFAFCGFPLPLSDRVFTARYDRAYIGGSDALRLVSVKEMGVGDVSEGCKGVGGCLPNASHPSDHLPIAVMVEYLH